ncbi:MAG TPA: XdhC/CoxI family protein [Gemmatimonadaceae bacterium]|nr:XdhC/CoxI family protein [Gemmatimonadaceae bacterium]
MKRPPDLIAELLDRHDSIAMATLVGARGSSSARVGSRMWIGPDGSAIGAVTIGGCVDARAIELSAEVLADGQPRRVEMALGDEDARAIGMTCAGTIELLVERVDRGSEAARDMLGRLAATRTLVIVGAGEIGLALARIARTLDLRVVVVDGRDHLATGDRFPDADEIRVGIPSEIVESLGLSPSTALVLVSHEYKYDLPILKAALTSEAGYIGMLGGRKRRDAMKDLLRGEGVPEAALGRLHAPIGLSIGAESPAEIAVSIAAELVKDWKRV